MLVLFYNYVFNKTSSSVSAGTLISPPLIFFRKFHLENSRGFSEIAIVVDWLPLTFFLILTPIPEYTLMNSFGILVFAYFVSWENISAALSIFHFFLAWFCFMHIPKPNGTSFSSVHVFHIINSLFTGTVSIGLRFAEFQIYRIFLL